MDVRVRVVATSTGEDSAVDANCPEPRATGDGDVGAEMLETKIINKCPKFDLQKTINLKVLESEVPNRFFPLGPISKFYAAAFHKFPKNCPRNEICPFFNRFFVITK